MQGARCGPAAMIHMGSLLSSSWAETDTWYVGRLGQMPALRLDGKVLCVLAVHSSVSIYVAVLVQSKAKP